MAKAKEVGKAAGATAAGAAVGAIAYNVIGGIGIAVGGTAVGVTLGPFVAVGAGISLVSYGVYNLGKRAGKKQEEEIEQ